MLSAETISSILLVFGMKAARLPDEHHHHYYRAMEWTFARGIYNCRQISFFLLPHTAAFERQLKGLRMIPHVLCALKCGLKPIMSGFGRAQNRQRGLYMSGLARALKLTNNMNDVWTS
jgi:hypothetical protein